MCRLFQPYRLTLKLVLLGLSIATVDSSVAADTPSTVQLPSKENFHLYLLAGQSNMAGRGFVKDQDKVPHARVLMQNQDGEWVPAVDPVHYDKSVAGVGPGRTFAITLAEQDDDVVIGLIPAACGGSSITSWVPGGYHNQTKSHPYDDAIARTELAMKDGTLKGILWHQGESDGKPERSQAYKQDLEELIARFRTTFDDPDLPFIIGQLGHFKPWGKGRKLVDQSQQEVAEEIDFVGFVPSDGLTSNPDKVHFDAKSQREFGRRYAEVYLEVIGETAGASTQTATPAAK